MTTETLADGRYRLGRELGRGGMATVYLAEDTELGRPVAVKVLAGHLAGDEAFRARFLREARLAASLSHPNVVQVFDLGEEDGQPWIVMEYVSGTTLADELARSGPLAPDAAVALARQACAGLEHAHRSGIVHRDVKPQNLLLREDGAVKIADFGIARAADETLLTQAGTLLGTAAYLAPEQAAGEPVTAAADVYSLGVVLYELLAGRTPFRVSSLADLAALGHGDGPKPLRELVQDVPPELEAVVMRCLARNPAYRPASPAAIVQELDSPERPTEPLPARAPRRHRSLPRSRRAALAAAALAAGALALGLWAATSGGADPVDAPAGERVEPVPAADDPAAQARNLADWLRARAEPSANP